MISSHVVQYFYAIFFLLACDFFPHFALLFCNILPLSMMLFFPEIFPQIRYITKQREATLIYGQRFNLRRLKAPNGTRHTFVLLRKNVDFIIFKPNHHFSGVTHYFDGEMGQYMHRCI